MGHYGRDGEAVSSGYVLEPKGAEELSERRTVIPAKAGIQNFLIFLDSGSR
jgi:hypothetical protein